MPVHPSPFTPIDDAAICSMHREGLPLSRIARAIHKSDRRVRARLKRLAEDGRIALRERTPRTDESETQTKVTVTNTGKRLPHNADDHRPLALGVKPVSWWSWAGRIAREVEQ